MFSIIAFYFKTFFKSLRNWIPILLLSFGIIGYCIFFNKTVQGNIVFESEVGHAPIQRVTFGDDKLTNLESEIDTYYSDENWKAFYEKTIEYYKSILENNSNSTNKDMVTDMERFQYLLDNNLPFIDEFHHNDGLFFLKNLMMEPIVLLIVITIIISSSQVFSSEMENKTYKLLYTQPISKTKIFFSKLISNFIINFFIVLALIFLCFIYQCITKGMGYTKFPVKASISNELIYLPLIKYVLYEFILLTILIIFSCSIGTLISLLINNSAASICVSTVFYGLIYILFKNNPTSVIQKYNPGAYFDINRILASSPVSGLKTILPSNSQGESLSEGVLTNITFLNGIIILSIMTIIFITIGIFLSNRKRMDN